LTEAKKAEVARFSAYRWLYKLCNATTKGAELGSEELWFYPGEILGGKIGAEIGTAGSIPMLLITVLPICAFARSPAHIHISKGGTDVTHSPTINYLCHVFLPLIRRIGLKTSMQIHRYGYYPKGMGEVSITVWPNPNLAVYLFAPFWRIEESQSVKQKPPPIFLKRGGTRLASKSSTTFRIPFKRAALSRYGRKPAPKLFWEAMPSAN